VISLVQFVVLGFGSQDGERSL